MLRGAGRLAAGAPPSADAPHPSYGLTISRAPAEAAERGSVGISLLGAHAHANTNTDTNTDAGAGAGAGDGRRGATATEANQPPAQHRASRPSHAEGDSGQMSAARPGSVNIFKLLTPPGPRGETCALIRSQSGELRGEQTLPADSLAAPSKTSKESPSNPLAKRARAICVEPGCATRAVARKRCYRHGGMGIARRTISHK